MSRFRKSEATKNRASLHKARRGDEFQIKSNGKWYTYVGRTVNGLFIYEDEKGRLFDRSIAFVHKLVLG